MDKILEEFNRELREAALSFDVEQFKSFFTSGKNWEYTQTRIYQRATKC